jgi:hypothetical protein
MFSPLLWSGEYLGVLITANAARGTFGEADLAAQQAFAALAAACFVRAFGIAFLGRARSDAAAAAWMRPAVPDRKIAAATGVNFTAVFLMTAAPWIWYQP